MDRLYNFYITNTTSRIARSDRSPEAWRNTDTQHKDITPYLGLRSRLSQVWINRWTVLLFLVLVRTLLAIADIESGIHDAKREALSSCTGVQNVGSAMASMPHYMAQGVNELTAHGVEKAINGLWDMLLLTVTGVEELVVFAINLLTSTYVCLITLVISGSLHVALQVIEDVADFVNKTIGTIGTDIHHGIDDFDKGLNKVIGAFSGGKHPLNLDGSLDKLDHLQLPSSLDQGLTKLNNSIPDFAQVNNFTNNAIRFPFEEIKKLLNSSYGNYTFDRSLFPIPQKEQLTFCSDDGGIAPFFDGLLHIELTARKVAVAVIVILAILVCIPMGYREVRRWRLMQAQGNFAQEEAYDTLDIVYIISRPYTSLAGIKLGKLSGSYRRQTLIRWTVAYATSPAALFVLTLGLAGLFAAFCHYLVLQAVVKEAPKLVHEVGDFADKVVDSLQNASMQWANGTNHMILDMNTRINHDVFGWVNTATSAMNTTLNAFSDEMTSALNATFGGTVLYGPVTEVFNCLIGLKIAGIEKGLTWVHDNAHIDFPLLPNNTFSLGNAAKVSGNPQAESMLTTPQNDATGQITGVLKILVAKIEHKIRTEAIISACVLAVYLIVVLLGILRALSLAFGKNGTRPISGQDFRKPIAMDSLPPTRHGATADEKSPAVVAVEHDPANPFRDPIPEASHDLVPPPPTYNATSAVPAVPAVALSNHNPSINTGSNYRGQDYTLKPRAMPSFSVRSRQDDALSPDATGVTSPEDANMRFGAERPVGLAVERPGIQRLSSHPEVVGGNGRGATFADLGR